MSLKLAMSGMIAALSGCLAFLVYEVRQLKSLLKDQDDSKKWHQTKNVRDLRGDLWSIQDRCDKTSNNVTLLETRKCQESGMAHEVLRMSISLIYEVNGDGDPCYAVRRMIGIWSVWLRMIRRARPQVSEADVADAMQFLAKMHQGRCTESGGPQGSGAYQDLRGGDDQGSGVPDGPQAPCRHR